MFFDDQIDLAVKAIKIEKPIITLSVNYTYVSFSYNKKVVFNTDLLTDVDSSILESVARHTTLRLDVHNNKYTPQVSIQQVRSNLLDKICTVITDFLTEHGGHTNNKLSATYKWYKKQLYVYKLEQNPSFTKDLFNIMKFVRGITTSDETKTARMLLDLIKNRYESNLK